MTTFLPTLVEAAMLLRGLFVAITIGLVTASAGSDSSGGEPKVGSPAWKREFERKQAEAQRRRAEIQRQIDAGRAAMERRRTQGHSYAKQHTAPSERRFNAATAPSPGDCLKSFRKAARQATSFESLLPYVSSEQRENYRLAKSWGSDFDKLSFYQGLLGNIYRIDDVRIDTRRGKENLAYIDVICQTGGDFGYTSGRFTMKGEGNRWRMHAYKSQFASNFVPDPPEIGPEEYEREGLGYLEVQERQRERLRQEAGPDATRPAEPQDGSIPND